MWLSDVIWIMLEHSELLIWHLNILFLVKLLFYSLFSHLIQPGFPPHACVLPPPPPSSSSSSFLKISVFYSVLLVSFWNCIPWNLNPIWDSLSDSCSAKSTGFRGGEIPKFKFPVSCWLGTEIGWRKLSQFSFLWNVAVVPASQVQRWLGAEHIQSAWSESSRPLLSRMSQL